jgi:hypothetical protein
MEATLIRLNEAEALGRIEPFNCANGHNEPFHSNKDSSTHLRDAK